MTTIEVDVNVSDALNRTVQSAMSDVRQNFDDFHSSVSTRLDYLHTVCSRLSTAPINSPSLNRGKQTEESSRLMNINIFGVNEDRDLYLYSVHIRRLRDIVAIKYRRAGKCRIDR
jgi:hypothetical protein